MDVKTQDKKAVNQNSEGQEENLKYPRAIPFIISNEFCERFNYYGMRTILVLYMTTKLQFGEDIATVLYHIFTLLVYFFCMFGAILADSFIGKFYTILWLSIVYATGSSILTVGAVESWSLPSTTLTFVGLALIAIGSGGIKPCVAAFGAEQFKLPEQAANVTKYFSLFYFAINLGSFLSTMVTPLLREDIACFEMKDCFPAGFGFPALLMIVSIFIFVSGKFLYKIAPHPGNMLMKVFRCIGNAISTKRREKKTNPKAHWLDYAEEKCGKKLVMESKILLNVLVLYLPLPLFWALFDQQGSRWTFQATKMNGNLGFYTIKPDQMQIFNPLMILVSIPLYEYALYPLLKLVKIRRPLQKMALGGILAGVAFILSMIVQLKIDGSNNKTINILWQLPQYIVMTLGEVMFSVTGLEFSFMQAPESMKSVIQACWLLTAAVGNLIVSLIVAIGALPDQSMEFLLFAVLMFVDMGIFMCLSYRYKPIPLQDLEKIEETKK